MDQKFIWYENERKRIAAELHDQVGQNLTEIKIRLERMLSEVSRQPNSHSSQPKASQLEDIIRKTQNTIEEVRRISMNLRPAILDDLGLIAALHWFCREFTLTHPDINLEKQIELDDSETPETLKIVIFRVVQESFNNISRHANARIVSIQLIEHEEQILLMIQDNGIGFEPARRNIGFGLSNMRQRVQLSKGELQIISSHGAGTSIKAIWPLVME